MIAQGGIVVFPGRYPQNEEDDSDIAEDASGNWSFRELS